MEGACGGCKTSLGKMQTALPLCLAKGMQIHVPRCSQGLFDRSRPTGVGGKIGIEKKEMRLSNTTPRQAEVLPVQQQFVLSSLGQCLRGARALVLNLLVEVTQGERRLRIIQTSRTLKRHF